MLFDVMKKAFDDELEKIAGSMQGHVRGGRRPLAAHTLLQKEKDENKDTRKKLADLTKLSSLKRGLAPDAKTLGGVVLGLGAYHQARKIKRRYDMGRQMEYQQQQQLY